VRPLGLLVAVAALLAARPRAAAAQDGAIRFEITSVGDSTFSFPVGRHTWVKRGANGIAVDPRRHDILVARFTVVRVDHGQATALVTGQTTTLNTEHVALLARPSVPWYRQRTFWVGTVLGALLGAVVVSR
jgi:hypothetical protein